MVVAETIAGLGAIKTAFDIAKGLKDIDDAARRNAAVIELQEKILSAQQAQSELVDRIRELQTQVASFEKWDTEKERYQLIDFGGNTFAYVLKSDTARGEPLHRICPNCYERRTKSILQFRGKNAFSQDIYFCVACKTEFNFGHRISPQPRSAIR